MGAPQHLGPLRLVIGEVAMVAQIAQGQFPAFFRMIQTAMQPPLLLAERELQVALEGVNPLRVHPLFEFGDRSVALRQVRHRAQAVTYIADQRLVVAAVEHAQRARGRQALAVTLEKPLAALVRSRCLETDGRHPERVEAGEHAAHHAVLACAVGALQDEQHGVLTIGHEHALLLAQPLLQPGQLCLRLRPVQPVVPRRITPQRGAGVAQAVIEQAVRQAHGGFSPCGA